MKERDNKCKCRDKKKKKEIEETIKITDCFASLHTYTKKGNWELEKTANDELLSLSLITYKENQWREVKISLITFVDVEWGTNT